MYINSLSAIRLANGRVVALEDTSYRFLYSTVDLLTGFTDSEVRAFNYVESETVSSTSNLPAASRRTATERDTNIASSNEMDATEHFWVFSIKVEAHQFTHNSGGDGGHSNFTIATAGHPVPRATSLSYLFNRLTLTLEAAQKDFPKAGLGFFVTGFGPQIAVATPNAGTARTYANSGVAAHSASDVFPTPLLLGGTEDYAVVLRNSVGPGGSAVTFFGEDGSSEANQIMQLRIYLCGMHVRMAA